MYQTRVQVLHVDDNSAHCRHIHEAMHAVQPTHEAKFAGTAAGALAFLKDGYRPQLIVMDTELPARSGLELLRELKGSAEVRHIPVVVLTSARDAETLALAYESGANCVVQKPADPGELMAVSEAVAAFWLGCAVLPAGAPWFARAARTI